MQHGNCFRTTEASSTKLCCVTTYSLAMDYHRPVLGVRVVVHHIPHPPAELEEGVGEGVRVARPLRVVEQDHLPDDAVLSGRTIVYLDHMTYFSRID